MATPDGNYLLVVHVKGQEMSTFSDTNLGHAKDDAFSRAKALIDTKAEFHICIVSSNDVSDHWLDIYTRNGRIPGVGPVTVRQ